MKRRLLFLSRIIDKYGMADLDFVPEKQQNNMEEDDLMKGMDSLLATDTSNL